MWTLFHYMYRDAGNYKVRGTLALAGSVKSKQKAVVEASLESGEYFIAEQVGIPPLQAILQGEFGGPNRDDHCWHTFDRWECCEVLPPDLTCHNTLESFIARFDEIESWKGELSPSFGSFCASVY